MTENDHLTEIQQQIFENVYKNNATELKSLLAQYNGTVDFVDKHDMTPLQHACHKGSKEAVQLLLDQGADVNSCNHGSCYTALHFGALSGNSDLCLLLLLAGANTNALNSVNRTPSQMAAFVGSHAAVATINNFIPKSIIEYYTKLQGQQTEPYLPVILLDSFHRFVIQSNNHPVRVALNLQKFGSCIEYLKQIKKVLELMCEREFHQSNEIKEHMALKYHYLSWVVGDIIRCKEHCQTRKEMGVASGNDAANKTCDYVELFAKRILKENKVGVQEYLESMIIECVREFPFRESTVFREVVSQLSNKDCGAAYDVIKSAINGQRGFVENPTYCNSCGEENTDKKCSKCREVHYCDRECQRLHWFMHKKTCSRPTTAVQSTGPTKPNEIAADLSNMMADGLNVNTEIPTKQE